MTEHTQSTLRATRMASESIHRFEKFIIRGLAILISIITVAAFWGLVVETFHLLELGAFDTLSHKAFQAVFGTIMTLLIAIEFNHTIVHAHIEENREVIVKTVVLVAILAISRQFIVSEIETLSPFVLMSMALSLLSLGIVYWLMSRTPPLNGHAKKE